MSVTVNTTDDELHGPHAPMPPQDIEAEQSVLGAMMLSRDAIADVIEVVRPGEFYRPDHGVIFRHVVELFGRGEPADAVTVRDALEQSGELTQITRNSDTGTYLHTLLEAVPTAANATFYAEIVADRAQRRRIIEEASGILQQGYGGQGEAAELLDRAQERFSSIGRSRTEDMYFLQDLADPLMSELERIQRNDGRSGIPTGFTELDRLTNGLQPGQLAVVAARPGLGKSALALDIARSAAIRHRRGTALFSLEMGHGELMMRLVSAEAKVRLDRMRGGYMSEADWSAAARRTGDVQDAPLVISDAPNMTMMEIRARARRLKQRGQLDLVIVDYLQLMTSGRRVESRQQEVSEFSRNLKLLAKELEVPVVALSQLNRGPEQRLDKKPELGDLRESGSIEQDADLVVLLHRPDAFERDTARVGEADLILAKQRSGPTGVVTVAHQLHYSRFVDMAPEPG
ncbi:replicative DNA helicase [Actinopolyspora erythraea]|uniref:Replicative DNA helicase n=1 Tax=Actinopolyspora erythraea TaxID=414996 RepID=A0A099D2Q9_9ACTN|nr:replicative DNA helicase [Actinopolyspora erythraea]ASU77266.1 replicative DNA helicase [Actinopolyspora erythraea]KGI80246.1 helicase DnaB [Actinopolyspora erythraea]